MENRKLQIRYILQYNPVRMYIECAFVENSTRTGRVFLLTVFKTAFHTALHLSRCIRHPSLRKASTCWARRAAWISTVSGNLPSFFYSAYSERRITNMPVSATACTQKAWLTEASIAFQWGSMFIRTCWNHLCANKTGNSFKDERILKTVSVCLDFLPCPLFHYLHLDKIKRVYLHLEKIKTNLFCMWMQCCWVMRLLAPWNLIFVLLDTLTVLSSIPSQATEAQYYVKEQKEIALWCLFISIIFLTTKWPLERSYAAGLVCKDCF